MPQVENMTDLAWLQSGKDIQQSVETKRIDFHPRLSSYMAVGFDLEGSFPQV